MSTLEQAIEGRMIDTYGDWPLGVECAWPAAIYDTPGTTEPLAAGQPAKSQRWQDGANERSERVVIAFPLHALALKGAC